MRRLNIPQWNFKHLFCLPVQILSKVTQMNIIKLLPSIFFLFVLSNTSMAQDDDYEHLLKNRKLRFSVFAAPIFEFSQVNGSFGFSSGGGGAILLNQTLFVGGYGLKLAPVINKDLLLDGQNFPDLEIEFKHGGFWVGYIHDFRKLVHFGGSAKFGWGNISMDHSALPGGGYDDNVLVITPQLEAEINIAKWFKINGGLGYRMVTSVNENVFSRSDFSSLEASITFMFGWFRQKN